MAKPLSDRFAKQLQLRLSPLIFMRRTALCASDALLSAGYAGYLLSAPLAELPIKFDRVIGDGYASGTMQYITPTTAASRIDSYGRAYTSFPYWKK